MARPPKVPLADRPLVMTAKELRTALRVSPPTFARHSAAGDYDRFELKPRIGHPRYSRRLVEQYLNGEPVYATPVFGAKRRQAS
jgi:hypothetical protein